ncbi:MAG: protein kinase [Myxococcota bacterium]
MTLDTNPGDVFVGRYRIEAPLGQGAMGWVYVARQLALDRLVALKLLPLDIVQSEKRLARFQREAQALSLIQHKNVVQLIDYDVDERSGQRFLVLELVRGRTLLDALRDEGAFDEDRSLEVALGVGQALVATHAQGIIHRDLKPANIMLVRLEGQASEEVKVLDFGLVTAPAPTEVPLTAQGSFLGTPEFAAPEQFLGNPVEVTSDLYALGCVLFACLTARAPYVADSFIEIAELHLNGAIPELPDAVRPELRALVRRLLAKVPAQRPASAAEVVATLEGIRAAKLQELRTAPVMLAPTEVRSAPRPANVQRRALIWGLLTAAAILGLAAWLRDRPAPEPERLDAPPAALTSTAAPRMMAIPRAAASDPPEAARAGAPASPPSRPPRDRRPDRPRATEPALARPDAGYPVW